MCSNRAGAGLDAPDAYGPRKTLYNRFVRWSAKGVWVDIFHALASAGGPPAQVLIDSSAVKAHRCASGARSKNARITLKGETNIAVQRPVFTAIGISALPFALKIAAASLIIASASVAARSRSSRQRPINPARSPGGGDGLARDTMSGTRTKGEAPILQIKASPRLKIMQYGVSLAEPEQGTHQPFG